MTFLKTSLITLFFSIPSFAVEPDIAFMQHLKGFHALVAFAHDQPALEYLDYIKNIPNSEELQVSVKQFNELLQSASGQVRSITNRPDVNKALKEFISANAISPMMVGRGPLKAAEVNFANIIIMLEFQKMISARSDLHYFGKGTIENLNYSIYETIQIFLKIAEANLAKVLYSKDATVRIRNNFSKALDYNPVLTPADKWLNQYLEKDPNYKSELTIEKMIEAKFSDNVAITNRKLRGVRGPVCGSLFS